MDKWWYIYAASFTKQIKQDINKLELTGHFSNNCITFYYKLNSWRQTSKIEKCNKNEFVLFVKYKYITVI